MHRNNPLKSSKVKKAPTFHPATIPATLNVVDFGFRVAGENTEIEYRSIEWSALGSESKGIKNK